MLVQPKLLENQAADIDLRLRDVIIDGVNGYEYVQLDGVPVYVNPESMLDTNRMAQAGLSLNMEIGPDDISVIQHQSDFNPVFDDSVTLMVHGQAKTVST